jgi:hypothetical protein
MSLLCANDIAGTINDIANIDIMIIFNFLIFLLLLKV